MRTEKKFQHRKFVCQGKEMTDLTDFSRAAVNQEITQAVRDTVDGADGVSMKDRIRSAARLLRLPFGRVQKYKYGAVGRIDAHEADQIRHYAREAKRAQLAKLARQYNNLRTSVLADAALAGDDAVASLLPPPIAEETDGER